MSNNSLILGHFLPSYLLQQSTPIRRLTSTNSDSGDSGVDPSYRQKRRIFVGGVPSSVGPEELANFFQNYRQVEEAFIIYDRYSGRHRGFYFVIFADMTTRKAVCSTRIFNLHGRKIECKRALKREEILATNEDDSNDYKSFRSNNSCPSPPLNSMARNIQLCPTSISLSYGQYRQSSSTILNTLDGWIVNPSIQTIPQIVYSMFNLHHQYDTLKHPLNNSEYPVELSASIVEEEKSSLNNEKFVEIPHFNEQEQYKIDENKILIKRINDAIRQCIHFRYIHRLCELKFEYRYYPLSNEASLIK